MPAACLLPRHVMSVLRHRRVARRRCLPICRRRDAQAPASGAMFRGRHMFSLSPRRYMSSRSRRRYALYVMSKACATICVDASSSACRRALPQAPRWRALLPSVPTARLRASPAVPARRRLLAAKGACRARVLLPLPTALLQMFQRRRLFHRKGTVAGVLLPARACLLRAMLPGAEASEESAEMESRSAPRGAVTRYADAACTAAAGAQPEGRRQCMLPQREARRRFLSPRSGAFTRAGGKALRQRGKERRRLRCGGEMSRPPQVCSSAQGTGAWQATGKL